MSKKDLDYAAHGLERRPHRAELDKITCQRCGQVWAWPAGKVLDAGTCLFLLNHAAGHAAEAAKKGGAK